MANWYVSSVGWTAVTQWAASTAYTVGQYRRQLATPTVGNERVFRCTTAGTSGGTEPAWNLGNNATTNDGTAVWTQVGGQEAHQSAGNWTAPLARYASASTLSASNDTVFVSQDHAETQTTNLTFGSASVFRNVVCVSRTGATIPPTSSDLATTATVSTTGAANIIIQGVYVRGVTFSAGSGASSASISFYGIALTVTLKKCALVLANTNASSRVSGDPGTKTLVELDETTITFGAVGQRIDLQESGFWVWKNTPSAISGSVPTVLVQGAAGNQGNTQAIFSGVDLSALSSALYTSFTVGQFYMLNCRLHPSVTIPTAAPEIQEGYFRMHNCDDSTNNRNYRFYELYKHGSVTSEAVVYRTGGASDGVTPLSHKYFVPGAVTFAAHLFGNWIGKRYNTNGASKTLTVEMLAFSSAIPTTAQLWLEVNALTSATSPLSTGIQSGLADYLATSSNLAASTEAWGAGVTARANSTGYTVGDLRKVASNPGRVFVCTATGTSSGSEPAGFATAVDGGSVTDGAAVWQAGWRVKSAVTFTPEMKGMVQARVHMNMSHTGLDYRTTVYVDPKLTIA